MRNNRFKKADQAVCPAQPPRPFAKPGIACSRRSRICSRWLLLRLLFKACLLLSAAAAPEQAAAGQALTDGRGSSPSLKQVPARIASGTIASDEILWLILNRARRAEKLIAVSTLADSAEYSHLSSMAHGIRGRVGGSTEQLLNLRPDLVVLAGFNRPELVRQTESLGMTVWIMNDFRSLSDISAEIRRLGILTGEETAAEGLAAEFEGKVAECRQRPLSPAPRIIGLSRDKSIWGSDTLFHDLAEVAGGINLPALYQISGWPKLSPEFMATLKPEWIVMSGSPEEKPALLKEIRGWPEIRSWQAVQDNRLILIPARSLHAASPFILDALTALRNGIQG